MTESRLHKVTLADAFATFSEHWSPRIIGELNGQYVKLAKIAGAFEFHHHPDEDELFLVVGGRMRMEFRDSAVELGEGEILIVPRGVDHRPVADHGEAHILMFEPVGTLNTGNVQSDRTVSKPEWL